jgi:hypothetical protein
MSCLYKFNGKNLTSEELKSEALNSSGRSSAPQFEIGDALYGYKHNDHLPARDLLRDVNNRMFNLYQVYSKIPDFSKEHLTYLANMLKVANVLKKNLSEDVIVTFKEELTPKNQTFRAAGVAYTGTKFLFINLAAAAENGNLDAFETILHELIHIQQRSFLTRYSRPNPGGLKKYAPTFTESQKAIINEIESLYRVYKNARQEDKEALHDTTHPSHERAKKFELAFFRQPDESLEEFVTYALTSEDFQSYLATLDTPKKKTTKKNKFLRRLFELLAKLFGLDAELEASVNVMERMVNLSPLNLSEKIHSKEKGLAIDFSQNQFTYEDVLRKVEKDYHTTTSGANRANSIETEDDLSDSIRALQREVEEEEESTPETRTPVENSYTGKVDMGEEVSVQSTKYEPLPEDENGNSKGYKNTLTGKILKRITDEVEGGLSWFRKNKTARRTAEQVANDFWGNRSKADDNILPTEFGKLNWKSYSERVEKSFNMGKWKGDIIHAILQGFVTGDPDGKIADKLQELYSVSGLNPKRFKWVVDNAKYILQNSDINIFDDIPENMKDKIMTEIIVGNDIFGLAGRIDLLIKHFDGTLSIKDYKTGYAFNNEYMASIFHYGDQGVGSELLWDNPRNRAKLQVMLYALTIKMNNPNAKFKALDAIWLPNQDVIYSHNFRARVEVDAFLAMIQAYLKNEQPEKYAAMKKSLGEDAFNRLWTPSEYQAGYSGPMREQMARTNMTNTEMLLHKLDLLKHNVFYDLSPHSLKSRDGAKNRARKAAALTEEILELKSKVTDLDLAKWDEDISYLSLYLGSNASTTSPYIQVYDQLLKERKARYHSEYQRKYTKFLSLLNPIYNAYMQRTGRSGVQTLTRNQLVKVDANDLYGFMIKERRNEEGELIDYEYRHTEKDWQELINDNTHYGYINASNIQMYKNFANYVMDTFQDFFIDSGGKTALANRVATYTGDPTNPKAVTNLELANGALKMSSNKKHNIRPFEYWRGFMPKVPKAMEEFKSYMDPDYWAEAWKRFSTFYQENQFEQWSNEIEAIPMKYMGNQRTNTDVNQYSFNVERQFDRFTRAMLYKEHMDEVFALGKGIQWMLSYRDDKRFSHTIEYLDKAIRMQVQGRTQIHNMAKKSISKNPSKTSILKLLMGMTRMAAAPIMWFNWVGGTANGIFTNMYLRKEAIKNSILAGDDAGIGQAALRLGSLGMIGSFKGIEGNHVDFTVKDLRDAWPDVMDLVKHAMNGDIRQSKTYLMLKSFNYLPDNWDWATNSSELMSASRKILNSSTPYIFYSLPEELAAAHTMIAQLRRMKIGHGSMKGTSLWEMYELVDQKDENGNIYKELQWRKDPKTGKAFIRGYVPTSDDPNDPQYEAITELQSDEIRKVFYVYERMHGGYRAEERTLIEYFIVGQVFMQFRRYMPNILRNAMKASGKISALGTYLPKMDENGKIIEKDGAPVLEWQSRVMEGRWRVLGKALQTYIGLRSKIDKKESEMTVMQKIFGRSGMGRQSSYKWDELSDGQKEALVDAMLTLHLMFGAFYNYTLMFGGDIGDDDSWAKVYMRIINDLTAQYNPYEIMKNMSNISPIAFKKARDLLVDSTDLTLAILAYGMGDEERAFDSRGNLQGWVRFQRDVPFLSAYRRTVHFAENISDEWHYVGFGF